MVKKVREMSRIEWRTYLMDKWRQAEGCAAYAHHRMVQCRDACMPKHTKTWQEVSAAWARRAAIYCKVYQLDVELHGRDL